MEEEKTQKSGKKKAVIGIVVVLLFIIIIVLVVIIYNLLHKEPETEERGTIASITTEQSDEEDDGSFTTDMNVVWTFPSGKRTSKDAVIGNSEYNKHNAYFEVYLDDKDQTLLYSSPILPVGRRLDKLKLDRALSDGEHEAICTFHILDDDDQSKEISRISFNVTLVFM